MDGYTVNFSINLAGSLFTSLSNLNQTMALSLVDLAQSENFGSIDISLTPNSIVSTSPDLPNSNPSFLQEFIKDQNFPPEVKEEQVLSNEGSIIDPLIQNAPYTFTTSTANAECESGISDGFPLQDEQNVDFSNTNTEGPSLEMTKYMLNATNQQSPSGISMLDHSVTSKVKPVKRRKSVNSVSGHKLTSESRSTHMGNTSEPNNPHSNESTNEEFQDPYQNSILRLSSDSKSKCYIPHDFEETFKSGMFAAESFRCEFCRKVLSKKSSLQRHILQQHIADVPRFKCSICGFDKTKQRSNLKKHYVKAHQLTDDVAKAMVADSEVVTTQC